MTISSDLLVASPSLYGLFVTMMQLSTVLVLNLILFVCVCFGYLVTLLFYTLFTVLQIVFFMLSNISFTFCTIRSIPHTMLFIPVLRLAWVWNSFSIAPTIHHHSDIKAAPPAQNDTPEQSFKADLDTITPNADGSRGFTSHHLRFPLQLIIELALGFAWIVNGVFYTVFFILIIAPEWVGSLLTNRTPADQSSRESCETIGNGAQIRADTEHGGTRIKLCSTDDISDLWLDEEEGNGETVQEVEGNKLQLLEENWLVPKTLDEVVIKVTEWKSEVETIVLEVDLDVQEENKD